MRKLQRNVKVVKALLDVTGKTAGIGHQLANGVNLGTLQRHTACHDQTDVSGTKNDYVFAGEIALHVNVLLRGARTENTRGTVACKRQRTGRSLTASHGKDHSLSLDLENAFFGIGGGDHLFGGDVQHHGVEHIGDLLFKHLCFITPCVFGAGQLLAKAMQTKAVVDTLTQNTAKGGIALQDQNIGNSFFVGCHRCTHACGAAANDDKINLLHLSCPPWYAQS